MLSILLYSTPILIALVSICIYISRKDPNLLEALEIYEYNNHIFTKWSNGIYTKEIIGDSSSQSKIDKTSFNTFKH